MNMLKYMALLFLAMLSCDNDDDIVVNESLASLVAMHAVEVDNVIACASGLKDDENSIIAYLYPRLGATDIRYYETTDIEVDKNEYQNYKQFVLSQEDLFNGYLKKITRITDQEKWVIITFFENDTLQLSNPIRLKHKSKPTEFTDALTIDNKITENPIFFWEDGVYNDSAIYFQVVSDSDNTLLSGTYTIEKTFQYYDTTNVVLNITNQTPPDLIPSSLYNFTLMGVSEDNWVNLFVEKNFIP